MRNNTICVAKTKEPISYAVTARLICAFVFAYAKSGFITTRIINTPERADSKSNMILVFDTKNCVAYVLSSCNMKTACVKAPLSYNTCRVSQTRFFNLRVLFITFYTCSDMPLSCPFDSIKN